MRVRAHLLCRDTGLPRCRPQVTRLARVSGFLASFSSASCNIFSASSNCSMRMLHTAAPLYNRTCIAPTLLDQNSKKCRYFRFIYILRTADTIPACFSLFQAYQRRQATAIALSDRLLACYSGARVHHKFYFKEHTSNNL